MFSYYNIIIFAFLNVIIMSIFCSSFPVPLDINDTRWSEDTVTFYKLFHYVDIIRITMILNLVLRLIIKFIGVYNIFIIRHYLFHGIQDIFYLYLIN